jgi:hypothetical protein
MVEADYRIASTSGFLLSDSLVIGGQYGTFFRPLGLFPYRRSSSRDAWRVELVGRGSLDVVDDNAFSRHLCWDQLQSQFFFESFKYRRPRSVDRRLWYAVRSGWQPRISISRPLQFEIVSTGEARLVNDRAVLQHLGQNHSNALSGVPKYCRSPWSIVSIPSRPPGAVCFMPFGPPFISTSS